MSKKTRREAMQAAMITDTASDTPTDTTAEIAAPVELETAGPVIAHVTAEIAEAFGMADMPNVVIEPSCDLATLQADFARAAEIPLPAIAGLSMDNDAAETDAEADALDAADALLDAEAAITATEPTSAESSEPAIDAPTVTYMLVIAGQHDTLASAAMHAQQYGKLARVTVCVARADTGETVQCFEHRGRGKRSDATDDGVHAPRGSAWDSKSGLAVQAMLRPEGATMDEMRMHTGWTFGKKYVAQLARSFHVTITTHDATARVKRTWHAEPAAGFIPVGEYVAPSDDADDAGQPDDAADDAGNVVQIADRMAAD